VVSISKALELF